jgi:hypothetical protein
VTLSDFLTVSDLTSLGEVDKVCYLAFYHLRTKKLLQFSPRDASKWLVEIGGATPNVFRLGRSLRASRNAVRHGAGYRLRGEFVRNLDKKFPALGEIAQNVDDNGSILPEVEYRGTRGYIEVLAKQINASYEHNLFDGCAVLMRRLLEILLVLSYRNLGIDDAIKDPSGNYQMLEGIVANAKANKTLNLSRNSKATAETFRELGNFSAHKIEYTCRREYLAPEIQAYRAIVTELLHKSGIRK